MEGKPYSSQHAPAQRAGKWVLPAPGKKGPCSTLNILILYKVAD